MRVNLTSFLAVKKLDAIWFEVSDVILSILARRLRVAGV